MSPPDGTAAEWARSGCHRSGHQSALPSALGFVFPAVNVEANDVISAVRVTKARTSPFSYSLR